MSLLCLLITSFLSSPSYSLDFTVQADLVFPRNNTVYQPVYPFPIVFALSNFSRAWKYMPTVGWELTKYELGTRATYFANSELAGWNKNGTLPSWGAQPDKYLSIHSSDSLSQYNESHWRLEWSFWVGKDDCLTGPDKKSHGSVGRIFFSTSNITGVMPNLTASGPCPFTLGVVGITGQNQTDEKCPLVSTPRPASTCGFTVDKPVVDQVAKAMVDISGCKNVTWPGGTGVGNHCSKSVETTSEGNRRERNFFAIVISLVTLGLLSSLGWI
jgi:hypothetical protein